MTNLLPFIKKAALLAAYGVIIFAGVSFAVPRHARLVGLKNLHQELETVEHQRQSDISVLRRNQERMLADSDFVVMILHKYRRIRPNELMINYKN